MGTRGTFGFRVKTKDKLAYNHFDSYLDGLGADVCDFIKGSTNEELKETARRILLVDGDKPPTKEQQKAVRDFEKKNDVVVSDTGVSSQSLDDWYCLLRKAQGKLDLYKLGLEYFLDGGNFVQDSLFCEYAYIINIDTGKLEVYEGLNKNPKAKGRYAKFKFGDSEGKYYGVALWKEVSFEDIRKANVTELVTAWEKEMSDEYEKENV